MKRTLLLVSFALVATMYMTTPITAIAGSTIMGKVIYSGKSEEQEFLLSKWPNAKFCASTPKQALVRGEMRILPTIEVNSNGGLKATVVAITDIEDKSFMEGYKGTEVMAEF